MKKIKAVSLFSGGLDSVLAVKIMKQQGIDILAVNFTTVFSSYSNGKQKNPCEIAGGNLNVKFQTVEINKDFLKILKNPKYGYGANINPCLDCRILIFKKAKKIMDDISASFIFTGEVLGQRPMSQRKKAIKLTEKESCLEGLIVRPLSAKLLEPTVPEKEGILDRNNFFGIQGKSRKPQIKLASLFKIKEYHAPAGGCRLTEPGFSRRVKDLMKFNLDFNLRDIKLLKIGRHFRLSPDAKLILGRNETENGLILNYFKKGDLLFLPENVPGPSGLGIGNFSRTDLKKSFEIIAFYSIGSLKNKDGRKVSIKYKKKGCSDTLLKFVLPAQKETFKNMLI